MELTIIIVILLNIFASVGIIFTNKVIFVKYDWNYATCLTSLHFFVIFIGCEGLVRAGYIKRKALPWQEAIPMGLVWSGSIIFANFSLRVNSTDYYQAMKLLLAPVIVVWQFVVFRVKTDRREQMALVPLIVGVGLITVSDLRIKLAGTLWAVLQLLSAAAVMTWVKAKQKQHEMDPTQLLHNNSLVCFVLMTPLSPGIDFALVGTWVWTEIYTRWSILVLLCSALFALLLNISIYKIIGFKGPIILQVVGFLKTVLIFAGGSWIFTESLNPLKWIGMTIAIGGLILYTYVKKNLVKEGELTVHEEVSKVELEQLLVEMDSAQEEVTSDAN